MCGQYRVAFLRSADDNLKPVRGSGWAGALVQRTSSIQTVTAGNEM